MKKFIDYLISLGYYGNGCTSLNFSSVAQNGTHVIFRKYNSKFIFGLNEKGNAPTLIFPRKTKFIIDDNSKFEVFLSDSEVSGYLTGNEPEKILNELYFLSIK